jgi:hypothetical protein
MLVDATGDALNALNALNALDALCMSDGSVDGKLKMETPRFEKHRRC